MFKTLNNEKGIALVLALMVLAAITMMGIAAIMTSTLDMQIASNERTGIQAQYAAEAGLAETIARLNLGTGEAGYMGTPITPDPPWPAKWANANNSAYRNWAKGFKGEIKSTDNKVLFNYTVTVKIKAHATKADWVAFYNHSSGYTKSLFPRDGSPVYYVESTGRSGNYRSTVTLDISKEPYNYKVKGGFTANGPVDMAGTPTVNGNQFSESGAAGGSCSDPNLSGAKPGVFANGTTDPPSAGTVTGSVPWERGGGTASTPWGAIGISEATFNDLFEKKPIGYTAVPKDELWIGGDETGGAISAPNSREYKPPNWPQTATGILVVHNNDFVPGTCPNNDYTSNTPTDVCYKQKAPAKLNLDGNVTFKGLIIADEAELRGNVVVIGAIVSLSTITTKATAAGNPTIKYSCEAIEKYAGGKVNRKLAWNVKR